MEMEKMEKEEKKKKGFTPEEIAEGILEIIECILEVIIFII